MHVEKQPYGFYPLFFTELCERFGFYTLQIILIFYMTKALLIAEDKAYLLYGAFSYMFYLTPVIGRYLTDRYLGTQRAMTIGGALFTIGYLLLAFPHDFWFFVGLSIIIIGNGLFKPNVSSYCDLDRYRNRGSLFYIGILICSLIPPLIAGILTYKYGWHSGFLLAALSTGIGWITLVVAGKSHLRSLGCLPAMSPLHHQSTWTFHIGFFLGVIACVCVLLFLFCFSAETNLILAIASLATLFVVIYLLFKEKQDQRNKMISCFFLILISVGFWAIYQQTFTSLMLYADRHVHKEFLGMTINAPWTRFFNPFFILLLSPMLSKLRAIPAQFSLGVLLMALGFFLLGFGGMYFRNNGEISSYWLMGSYLLQTLGELLLFPVSLAMIMTFSSKHVEMMMGVWFLTQVAASAIGGGLATLSSVAINTPLEMTLKIYDKAFFIYGGFSLVLAALSFFLIPYLKTHVVKEFKIRLLS